MPEVAEPTRSTGLWPVIKKRWRGWLRAFHRDFGYLAIGFTVIYAVSGIAQNHIEDWGDVSYRTYETQKTMAPIADSVPDAQAIAQVAALVDFGKPTQSFRAGDEIRLEYANGAKVTAIGTNVTIQGRERRAFIGVANWLHTARNRKGWKYVADLYAVLLLYLAISGIFMIKGQLGLKGRGAFLISAGVAVPVAAVLLSGPDARKASKEPAALEATAPVPAPTPAPTPAPAPPPAPPAAATNEAAGSSAENAGSAAIDTSGIKFLPPEDEEPKAKPCDPFANQHGCK